MGEEGGGADVHDAFLFYNFSGTIANKTHVIIGQKLKVRDWPLPAEFTSPNEYDSVVNAHTK